MQSNDKAVSPVIAVILMVAITVVPAAVVYVWVSGFNNTQAAPRSIGLQYAGHTDPYWNWTVTTSTPTLAWSDLTVILDGSEAAYTHTGEANTRAGDTLTLNSTTSLSGQLMRLVDTPANSIILTLTIP